MVYGYFDACDVQLKPSVASCGVCKREVYRYDPVASIKGNLVHEHCMTEEELEFYPVYGSYLVG